MIKKLIIAAAVAVASLSFVAAAQAEDFPARPMNSGPAHLTGLGPISDVGNVILVPVNVLTAPLVTASGPALVSEPAVRRHHRHHLRHVLTKKKL